MNATTVVPRRDWISWAAAGASALGFIVVLWSCFTGWGGVIHGHPAYAILLAVTLIACIVAASLAVRRRARRRGWRRIGRVLVVIMGIGWIAAVAWLRPHSAVQPALADMNSDSAVSVTESPIDIAMNPSGEPSSIGVFFQPGALVDARAYVSVLRPLAEDGHLVVIAKQPFGIAFFALGAFDSARAQHPEIEGWVVAGHSLGGTVAALEADRRDTDVVAPAVGLMFYASYPAADISESLTIPVRSISGSRDGLATPAKIEASRANLPSNAVFTIIEGASHAQFGDYGTQAGDNTPEISNNDARKQISAASLTFLASLTD